MVFAALTAIGFLIVIGVGIGLSIVFGKNQGHAYREALECEPVKRYYGPQPTEDEILEKAADKKRWLGLGRKLKSLKIGCIILAICGFLAFLCVPWSFHQIEAGTVAVVKHMGQVSNVRTSGTYFDFWMTEKYTKYDAKVQTIDILDSAYSKDAQTMEISMVVQYSIKPEEVKKIAEEYGSLDILENRIRSIAIEKTKGVLSTHKAMNDENDNNGIIENRERVGAEVTEAVKTALNGYYVNVNTVVLTNIDFTDAFEKIVEEKMIAEQEKLKAQYEKEKAIIKAQQDLEVAQKAADAKLYEAQKDAEAQKAIAEAEAYAASIKIVELAKTLGYSVTEEKTEHGTQYVVDWEKDGAGQQAILNYLQYLEYLAKWDGKLPDVVAGDNLSIFIPSTDINGD